MANTKPKPQKAKITQSIHETTAAEEALIQELRALCMSLPEANEKRSHGEPTWFAGKGKVFAMLDNHHHGAAHLAVWLPQPGGVQHELIEDDPSRFFKPPYVGTSGWVGVVIDDASDWGRLAGLIRAAYVQVAAEKLKAKLTGE